MLLTSNLFLIFILVSLVIYYMIPGRFQWGWLLVISMAYYLLATPKAFFGILYSILIIYFSARRMQQIYDQQENKNVAKKQAKRTMLCGLFLNLALLVLVKYTNFIVLNIASIAKINFEPIRFLVPLGISYYTFQSLSYLLDVYWKRTKAETNILKFALFLMYFPQLLQGPIGRYDRLAPQLTESHVFQWHNIQNGLERVIWGLFKKMLIADWAAVYRNAIFDHPEEYPGLAIMGVILYSIELYGDFSGGIDIVLGISELFGIHLDENFRQPYFSTSLSNFWQRWHITLGSWMKDYIFYPMAISKRMSKLGKNAQKVFGKKIGRKIPVCIANIVVFFVVGIWHGATWNYIVWGLYNGIVIAISTLLEDVFKKGKKKCHISNHSKGFHLFQVVRTFVIVNISWYFDCTTRIADAFYMLKQSVSVFAPVQLMQISAGKLGTGYTPYALLTIVIGCLMIFVVSLYNEKYQDVRIFINARPMAVRFLLGMVMIVCVAAFSPVSAGGFIYAQF